MRVPTLAIIVIITMALMAPFATFPYASAQNTSVISSIQSKINERTQNIQNLEKEIAQYARQINELSTQASSLSSTIKSLELTQKKLEADIKVTENKIAEKNLVIQQLGSQIVDKEETITDNRRIISRSYVTMNELGDKSLPELLLAKTSLGETWNSLEDISSLQRGLSEHIVGLRSAKANLETNKKATEKAKAELLTLGSQLNDQKKVVVATTNENNALLKDTKNNQANYTVLLAARQKQKEEFEREVSALEAELKIAIDPSSLPSAGSGVLAYPLDTASTVRVTQYFGNTEFATKNPQVYKGSSGEHNGIDFAASIGTPIRAAASGVVTQVITTRSSLRCGYGNWTAIRHSNGLTTLYAHLSLNTTTVGQQVTVGEVIGYSGNTGFTTGPHLHFGVYATQGFQTAQSVSCAGITIPIASLNAYLNPLSYL